jgi:hypothetical protein
MMTDGARGDLGSHSEPKRPRRRRNPSAGWVFGPALGAFFAVLALLGFQVRAGSDPALGEPAAQAQQPRQVLVRRVITRVVIHHPATPQPTTSSPAAVQASAPATTTTAPPPAPAPAPAPAPLTTQSS